MQKVKVDENMPAEVATVLAQAGHDAVTVPAQRMGGRPDPDIAAICRKENRVLVTLDRDFADIRAYPPQSSTPASSCYGFLGSINRSALATIERLLPLFEPRARGGQVVDRGRSDCSYS